MKNKIGNWFILFFLIFLLSSQNLLAQTKTESDKTTEKKSCASQECHSKSKKEEKITEEKKYTEEDCHKRFAVNLNNLVWNLLGKKNRTKAEDEKMIHSAHASLFHWSEIGKVINLQRGEWMVSHVYAVLNRAEPALYHAKICMDLTEKHNFVDFDLAYAYEAMARAYACAKDKSEALKYIKLAQEAGEKIEKKEDKKLFLSDFASGPWYDIK